MADNGVAGQKMVIHIPAKELGEESVLCTAATAKHCATQYRLCFRGKIACAI